MWTVCSDSRLWVVWWCRGGRAAAGVGLIGKGCVCVCVHARLVAQLRTNLGGMVGWKPGLPTPSLQTLMLNPKPPARVRPWKGKFSQDPSSSLGSACGFCKPQRDSDPGWENEKQRFGGGDRGGPGPQTHGQSDPGCLGPEPLDSTGGAGRGRERLVIGSDRGH